MALFGRGGQRKSGEALVDLGNLRHIANDLTNLEINTIVKQDLTARKMPGPPLAVLEVAEGYRHWLQRQFTVMEVTPGLPTPLDDPDYLAGRREALRQHIADGKTLDEKALAQGVAIFQILYEAGKRLIEDPPVLKVLQGDGRDAIATRIIDSSLVLKRLLTQYSTLAAAAGGWEPDLPQRDAVALRKIWEIGVQSVKMQTIIQLDGDVLTYVQESVARDPDNPVHRLHHESVGIAINSWRFLVETLGRMIKHLAGG